MTGKVRTDRFDSTHVGQERAPRLRPDQLLADSMTRVGRFAKVDPVKGRPLPRVVHALGVLGWAALAVESFRRARAARGDTTDRHRATPH